MASAFASFVGTQKIHPFVGTQKIHPRHADERKDTSQKHE
jgi:hypothetical protein